MKLFQKFGSGLEKAVVHVARSRVREHLMRFDDRLLEDAGFSRDLLNAGVEQWPWRADEADSVSRGPVFKLSAGTVRQVGVMDTRHKDAA